MRMLTTSQAILALDTILPLQQKTKCAKNSCFLRHSDWVENLSFFTWITVIHGQRRCKISPTFDGFLDTHDPFSQQTLCSFELCFRLTPTTLPPFSQYHRGGKLSVMNKGNIMLKGRNTHTSPAKIIPYHSSSKSSIRTPSVKFQVYYSEIGTFHSTSVTCRNFPC